MMSAPTTEQVKAHAAALAKRIMPNFPHDEKALHVYRKPDGTPIFWKMRVKTFAEIPADAKQKEMRPFSWDASRSGGGQFVDKEPPAPPGGKPLYALELLALHPNAMVLIVEGENKVDATHKTAKQAGALDRVVATTSGGASSARAADWSHLAGRHVVMFPDNDQAGLQYQADVIECLRGIAASVRIIDVAALNLPPKGDAVDHFRAGGTLEALMQAVDAAKPVEQKTDEKNSGGDADAPPQSDDEKIEWLASLKPLEYDRTRIAQAKELGVRPATLDAMVKNARADDSEADRLPFAEVEPCPDLINPAQLLDEVSSIIRQFIVLDSEQADAAALWVALTWFIDAIEVAPLAIIDAPEKSCGKTQLLTVLGRMAFRPLPASNASPSALFRAVELWKPTILIDESDTFFKENFELHGLVNAGYLRDGYVLRSEPVGDSFEPRMFSVFSAKALAGIALEKHLPDATMSRGIIFNLRRKLSHEQVSRLRHADRELFAGIAEKLARFAADYSQQVRLARPDLPDELSDRAQDNWEPLLAIASCAGSEWLARATAAALKLSGAGEKTVSTGNELLADVYHVFKSKKLDKLSTADLIAALCDDEEGAWAAYNRGKPITPRQVARLLKQYGLASKTIRLGAYETAKGFELTQFADVFARYLGLPGKLPSQGNKTPEANRHAAPHVTDVPSQKTCGSNSVTLETAPLLGCDAVTDKKPFLGGADAECENDETEVSL